MPQQKLPTSFEAVAALILACVAVGLAIFGVYNPWGTLQFPVEQKLFGVKAVLWYGGTCVLPIFLGLGAAGLGGLSYRNIDQANGKVRGDGQAFFALMIGLFAVTIGASTTFATLIWPNL